MTDAQGSVTFDGTHDGAGVRVSAEQHGGGTWIEVDEPRGGDTMMVHRLYVSTQDSQVHVMNYLVRQYPGEPQAAIGMEERGTNREFARSTTHDIAARLADGSVAEDLAHFRELIAQAGNLIPGEPQFFATYAGRPAQVVTP